MDKKAIAPIALVMAIFIGILLLIFLSGGGISSAWNLTKLISSITDIIVSIPPIIWLIIGGLFLLKLIFNKKR